MPWETEIHLKPADGDSNSKMDSILKTKSKICGVNYQGNYYGLLKSKFSSNGMDDAVDNVGVSPLSLNKSISDKKVISLLTYYDSFDHIFVYLIHDTCIFNALINTRLYLMSLF